MTKKETMLQEVVLSDKDIIERLTKENDELKEQNRELQIQVKDLKTQLKAVTQCIGSIEDTPEFIQLEFERNELFQQLEEIKNNNKIENSDLYINLKKDYNIIYDKNKEMENQIEDLNIKINNLSKNDINKDITFEDKTLNESKIQEALDSQKTIFDEKFNKYKKEQETKYNSLYNDFILLKNNVGIPTPSNSNEAKNSKIKKRNKKVPEIEKLLNNNKIKLHDDLYEIVYYRYVNDDKYLAGYHINNGIPYLECCGKQWDYRDLDNNEVTCLKCFKTYILNNDKKLIKNILPEHIILNEKDILNDIKCNLCEKIYKKRIELCNKCKCIKGCKPIITELPDEKVGIKTAECFASETFYQLCFYDKIYNTAKDEKINVYEMKPLVNYIKKNNLMKEKQPNIIIKKILRCRYILEIYNEEKYINIQDIIKRIYINLDYIPRLDDEHFNYFKNILIDILDKELKNNISNKDKSFENNSSIDNTNNNIKIDDERFIKESCIKCDNILKNDELRNCMNCDKLCKVDDCNNSKQKFGNAFLEYCKTHNEMFLNILN